MPLTRRELLKGIGAAAGALGITAAGYEHLVPFIHQPDNMVPGVSTWYATSCRECPAGCGILMESREARIIKAEGNPEHPINRGTLCARGQAALHAHYDPDRLKGPMHRAANGRLRSVAWRNALDGVGRILAGRPRIAFITDLQTGSLEALMRQWLAGLGSNRLLIYEPLDYASVKAASRDAVGRSIIPTFGIAGSDLLLSFAADFLETWISPVNYANQFTVMRQVRSDRSRARFVYVGPRVSMTAANADLRVLVPSGTEALVAQALTRELRGAGSPGSSLGAVASQLKLNAAELRGVADGLRSATAPLALPGGDENTARAAMALNGAMGSTLVDFAHPHALSGTAVRRDMEGLVSDMENGLLDVLVIFGANPVYSLPDGARFAAAMKRVPNIISLSTYYDETTARAHWILPSNTPYESWGDYSPQAGVSNLMQPTMGTLFDTRQLGDILIELARSAGLDPRAAFKATDYYDYLRNRWNAPRAAGESPDTPSPAWNRLLQMGGRWSASVIPSPGGAVKTTTASLAVRAPGNEIRLWAYPNIYLYDGRGANRWWLQEMTEPVIRAAWSTWAELHPSTAERLGIRMNDVVRISRGSNWIEVPAIVWEGVEPGTVAVPIGQGHWEYGRFARGVGANVWRLLNAGNAAVGLRNTGRGATIPLIQKGDTEHGRDIIRTVALAEPVTRGPITLPLPEGYTENDFYPGHEHLGHRWAMVVDLDRCIGCNACVAACYAENNLAVVGADGIRRNRAMAWLRIDRYFHWDHPERPIQFQPMLCQHCDSAPCEPVCPVYAAVHSSEGINEQIYNRCVGTRYCSNNCPYKVRRFNWFGYDWPHPLNYQLNPEVTVRSRGVMEKCTFCIQRIRKAEIVAKREGRPLRDGEVVPACAQTCPTGVYTFGDLMDPDSRVSKIIRNDLRAYQVLHELNTKPGVIYLKRIVERL